MNELRDRIIYWLHRVGNVPDEITNLNSAGVQVMMKGEIEVALELFFIALGLSGTNEDLRAQCLINIGDWVRRFPANLTLAEEIFSEANLLASTSLTRSRLYSMWAMVYGHRTSKGEHDPVGMTRSILTLRNAIVHARGYEVIDSVKAIEAESFALHRLAGIVCTWGSDEQKQELLPVIEEFQKKLASDAAEMARLNYSVALIIAPKEPKKAHNLLVDAAKRLWKESPADAGPYLILAAEIALRRLGHRHAAKEHLDGAEECLPVIRKFTPNKRFLDLYEELRQELG